MRKGQGSAATRGRSNRPALLLSLLGLVAALAPAVAMAGKHHSRHEPSQSNEAQASQQKEDSARCAGMSKDQAIASAERKYKARVVRVTVDTGGERCAYVLRLLSEDGRVWTVRVDSGSGG